jgi:hypothetical protein
MDKKEKVVANDPDATKWPVRQTASVLGGLAVGAASIVLVVLSVNAFSDLSPHSQPFIRLLVAGAGTALLLGAGSIIDWHMDQLNDEAWEQINAARIDQNLRKLDPKTANQFRARLHVFGGAYFLISLALSVLTFVMVWYGIDQLIRLVTEFNSPEFVTTETISEEQRSAESGWITAIESGIGAMFATENFVRLMTYDFKRKYYLYPAIFGSALVAVVLYFF